MSLLRTRPLRPGTTGHATPPAPAPAAVRAGDANTAQIVLDEVTRRFPGAAAPAVAGVSLVIDRGEIVALLGPSGCGKTTTLRLIAGFERPDAGHVSIAGTVVAGPGRWVAPERRNVGMVFQDYALFPHLTVAANVGFGLRSGSRREQAARVAETLALVGLEGFAGRYPHQLSGGQQQRVALARALAPRPNVVLLDEPFSNLDGELRAQVRRDVRDILRGAGATALLVTHDRDEAFAVADRIALMHSGRIVQVGTPADLYRAPATPAVASFLGAADLLPAVVAGGVAVSELGRIAVADGSPQGEAGLLLRPEQVFFADDGTPATVLTRDFRGADALYTLRLPSGRRIRSLRPASEAAREGDTVLLQCRPTGAVVFPHDACAHLLT